MKQKLSSTKTTPLKEKKTKWLQWTVGTRVSGNEEIAQLGKHLILAQYNNNRTFCKKPAQKTWFLEVNICEIMPPSDFVLFFIRCSLLFYLVLLQVTGRKYQAARFVYSFFSPFFISFIFVSVQRVLRVSLCAVRENILHFFWFLFIIFVLHTQHSTHTATILCGNEHKMIQKIIHRTKSFIQTHKLTGNHTNFTRFVIYIRNKLFSESRAYSIRNIWYMFRMADLKPVKSSNVYLFFVQSLCHFNI